MNRPAHYRMTKRPVYIPVKNRRDVAPVPPLEKVEILTVDKATECHVTPMDVAARMVDYLGRRGDFLTLEPSAGTGNLSRALLESGHSRYELCQVERHIKLASGLHEFGPVINRCFLEYAAEARGKVEFPRVIMNPPFREVRKHIAAAESLLGRNGHDCPPVLVALVPNTYKHARAEVLEHLGPDTFALARVHTKIIRITGD
jgi:predicted RNA methylase